MSEPTADQLTAVHRVAAFLCGSCSIFTDSTIEDEPLLKDLGDMVVQDWIERYGEIFLCVICGWWCESSEMADPEGGDGPICAECKDYQNDG